ncbi:hypothetical protein AB0I81_61235 [Nonomuraea sp. NPDC050404]|uniref:hypothetical protein n=1 Tax=Nonomuraea sp. NPDC050404 TaxID=3155783 RepID=UPI0033DC3095
MRAVTLAVVALALLAGGCAARDERHPISIAIAGTPSAQAAAAAKKQSQPAGQPQAGATVDPDDALLKVAQCLREQGIDVPDPGSPEDKTYKYTGDQATLQKAMKACEKYTSQIPNPFDDPKARDAVIQYARCMREQGIDMPDPPAVNQKLDPNDPKLQKAAEGCVKLLPGQGGTG